MPLSNWFKRRTEEHDKLEEEAMKEIRKWTTSRKHIPDRRVAFSDIPCSFDVKTSNNVEDLAHDEYFRLWYENHEPIFIIYDHNQYADWIINLIWEGPFSSSDFSTTGNSYYKISGGRKFRDFLFFIDDEIINLF